jgi:hypothetical protein
MVSDNAPWLLGFSVSPDTDSSACAYHVQALPDDECRGVVGSAGKVTATTGPSDFWSPMDRLATLESLASRGQDPSVDVDSHALVAAFRDQGHSFVPDTYPVLDAAMQQILETPPA